MTPAAGQANDVAERALLDAGGPAILTRQPNSVATGRRAEIVSPASARGGTIRRADNSPHMMHPDLAALHAIAQRAVADHRARGRTSAPEAFRTAAERLRQVLLPLLGEAA